MKIDTATSCGRQLEEYSKLDTFKNQEKTSCSPIQRQLERIPSSRTSSNSINCTRKQICQTLNAQQVLQHNQAQQQHQNNYCITSRKLVAAAERNMQRNTTLEAARWSTQAATKREVVIDHRKDRGRQRIVGDLLFQTIRKETIVYRCAPLILLSLSLLLLPSEGSAQCPWTRDAAELHSDCICDFHPSQTTNLEQQHNHQTINRMSVQCAPVDFERLIRALKQTASIEMPAILARKLHLIPGEPSDDDNSSSSNNNDDENDVRSMEFREAGLQLASQAKLDLLHVCNSSIIRLDRNSFIMDVGSSLGGNQLLPSDSSGSRHLVVAIQSLHLSRCRIELIEPGAFNGLEWSLTSLSLSDNQLQFVPVGALQRLTNLRVLDLSNNRLNQLSANSFVALSKLQTLRLADNRIGSHHQQSTPSLSPSNHQQQQQQQPWWFEFSAGSRANSSASGASGLDPMAFAGLEASLTDLNLKNTQLEVFPAAIKRLARLTFLNLAQNQISHIPGRSFSIMNSLTAINLERNRISQIEDETFYGVEESLSSLSLLGNLLETFPTKQLAKLISIRRLDLGFNNIEIVPSNAFASNKRLILVALDGNPIETLPEIAFKPLEGTLRGMSIGGKALNCDCRLSWVLRWQHEFNIQISSRERQPQFCAKPNYLRSLVSFAVLKPEHLTCAGSMQPVSSPSLPILPRNSTSNAWTANNVINDETPLSTASTGYQLLTSTSVSFSTPSHYSFPYKTTSTMATPTSSDEPPALSTNSKSINQAVTNGVTNSVQVIESPAPASSTKAASYSGSQTEASEQSTIIVTSTLASVNTEPLATNHEQQQIKPTNETAGGSQFKFSLDTVVKTAAEPQATEQSLNEAKNATASSSRQLAETYEEATSIKVPQSVTAVLEIPSSSSSQFGDRATSEYPQNSSLRSPSVAATITSESMADHQQQQQLMSNGVISLPDDELFVSEADSNNRKPLNRQGFVAQLRGQHRRQQQVPPVAPPIPATEPYEEIQRRTPAVTTVAANSRSPPPATTQNKRQLNRTTQDPTTSELPVVAERKRLRFGNRANDTTIPHRWENRRSSLATTPNANLQIDNSSGLSRQTTGSPQQAAAVPAAPTTVNVNKTAGQLLPTTQSQQIEQGASQVVAAGQRLPPPPHLDKSARFVDSVGEPAQQQQNSSRNTAIRLQPFRSRHHHQQPSASATSTSVSSSTVQSNSTRLHIDSSVERYPSASSASSSFVAPISQMSGPRQVIPAIADITRTIHPQFNKISSELPATIAQLLRGGDTVPPVTSPDLLASRANLLTNNTRMSVSSMYRLAKPAAAATPTAANSTTTTTPISEVNTSQFMGASSPPAQSEDPHKNSEPPLHRNRSEAPTMVAEVGGHNSSSLQHTEEQSLARAATETTTTRVEATVRIVESVAPAIQLKPPGDTTLNSTILTTNGSQQPTKPLPPTNEPAITESTEEVRRSQQDANQAATKSLGGQQPPTSEPHIYTSRGQQITQQVDLKSKEDGLDNRIKSDSTVGPSQRWIPEIVAANSVAVTTTRPQTTHATLLNGSSRSTLVTRESFGKVPRHSRGDDTGAPISSGFAPSRMLGRFIRLPDFDQLALVLAAVLCLVILSMALLLVCVCYTSYKSDKRSSTIKTAAKMNASSLSSFASSSEESATVNAKSQQQQQLQQQLAVRRSSSVMHQSGSNLLVKLFCCRWFGIKSSLRPARRLTPLRSLILQDDDNNSSGSSHGANQATTGATNGTASKTASSVLPTMTRIRGQNNPISSELLYQSTMAAKKSWLGGQQAVKGGKNVCGRQVMRNAEFDNLALELDVQGDADAGIQVQSQSTVEQEYFMGRPRSWTLAHGVEFASNSKRYVWAGQGDPGKPEADALSVSCDSDKSCSPGANRNNRYNINDAHRAYLASKGTRQIQASMFVSSTPHTRPGLLQAMQDHNDQVAATQHRKQQLGSEFFDGGSSDKSTTDDSRAPLSAAGRLQNSATQTGTLARSGGTRTFGVVPVTRSLRRVQVSSGAAPTGELVPSAGCGDELIPMSAEEQWPEPYVDPAEEHQKFERQRKDPRQFVQYRPEANYAPDIATHLHRSQNIFAMQGSEPGELDTAAQQRFAAAHNRVQAHHRASSGVLKSAGPHDDIYLANWHTMRRTGAYRTQQHRLMHDQQPTDSSFGAVRQSTSNLAGHSQRYHMNRNHQLIDNGTDTIHGLTNEANASLLRYRSIPSLNTVAPDYPADATTTTSNRKAFRAGQIVGATNWLRWTPTNFQVVDDGDGKLNSSSQQDNGNGGVRDPSGRSWNLDMDNQVDSMYVANGQQMQPR